MDQKVAWTETSEDVAPAESRTTTEARQAIAPHRLRYMLGAGIAAVVLGFFAVYFMLT